jgi:hypothetical protein
VETSKKNWEPDGRLRSDPGKPLTYQPFLKWELNFNKKIEIGGVNASDFVKSFF